MQTTQQNGMTEQQAKKAGALAFQAGKPRAPALNPAFVQAAAEGDGINRLGLLLGAYLHGWDVAHLAADALFDDMPSIAELRQILAD